MTIALALAQVSQRLALALAESGLALALEDEGDVDAGVVLDLGIAVDEGVPQDPARCLPTAVLPVPIGPIR